MDVRSLPIGPEEAFVLSRVDGMAVESDIALATGLPPERVAAALDRLHQLGAIVREREPHATLDSRPAPPHGDSSGAKRLPLPAPSDPPESFRAPALKVAKYDPAELEEAAELDPDRKRRVLDTFYLLDELDHYELFGVEPGADKKAIKQAYYEAVSVFHPDRYFGKSLGSFKPKLERIFAQMTEAHDVLTRKQSRAEYDEYLSTQRRTKKLEKQLGDDEALQSQLDHVRERIREQAKRNAGVSSVPPGVRPSQPRIRAVIVEEMAPRADRSSDPRIDVAIPLGAHLTAAGPRVTASQPRIRSVGTRDDAPSDPPSGPPSSDPLAPDEEARRRALARKLAGRSSAPPGRPSSAPSAAARHGAAADDLRHRYERHLAEAKEAQIQRYLDAAEQSLAEHNPVAASNALRLAASLRPDDLALAAHFQEVQDRATSELSSTYLGQARYEERRGHFLEAARSYARAARASRDGTPHERAAHCLLEAGQDPRAAVEHARQALALSPESIRARVTLARAYLASDMHQSALAELERALVLAPGDDSIKDWIKRVKKA